jgi:dolichol-phosphate mannosyltransferase
MLVILLPAYDEEKSLPSLLPRIDQVLRGAGLAYRIVVCNDGSGDRTGELLAAYAHALPLTVIEHRINRGLGETIRDLFEHAAETCAPGDCLVRMDCDDTHDPYVIVRLQAKLGEGYDVAIASRFQPGGGQKGVSAYRTVVSACANLFMRVFFSLSGVRDFSSGYRAYRAEFVQKAIRFYGNDFIQLKGLGFTVTLEKLLKLHLLGARFGEVPLMLRYDMKRSESKMVTSLTTLGYMVMTVVYYWPWGGWRWAYPRTLRRLRADAQNP